MSLFLISLSSPFFTCCRSSTVHTSLTANISYYLLSVFSHSYSLSTTYQLKIVSIPHYNQSEAADWGVDTILPLQGALKEIRMEITNVSCMPKMILTPFILIALHIYTHNLLHSLSWLSHSMTLSCLSYSTNLILISYLAMQHVKYANIN